MIENLRKYKRFYIPDALHAGIGDGIFGIDINFLNIVDKKQSIIGALIVYTNKRKMFKKYGKDCSYIVVDRNEGIKLIRGDQR